MVRRSTWMKGGVCGLVWLGPSACAALPDAAMAIFTTQVARFAGPDDSSYVFDGEAGTFGYGRATASAATQIAGAGHRHVAADEPAGLGDAAPRGAVDRGTAPPWRASDHDPVLVGLSLAGRSTSGPRTADASVPQTGGSATTCERAPGTRRDRPLPALPG